MSNAVEETALSVRTEQSFELAPTAAAAEKQFEIQSAIIIARKFPRNEDTAFQKLMKACQRSSFAEDAAYSFKRGDTTVEGPSINLAREAARVWGNIRHGVDVIRDDETTRGIRAWAWDLETNTKVSAEDEFAKLIYRKKGGWQAPDERDLRELTNRRAAMLKRNCLLEVLPKDLVEDALETAKGTLKQGAASDPEAARKKIIMSFAELNITPEMIEQKLGHPIAQCSPAELAELRTIYKSIDDGNSTWAEYANAASSTGGEPRRKSEAPAATAAIEMQAPTTNDASFDSSKIYRILNVTAPAKKGGLITLEILDSDGVASVLASTDQRFYITAQSAKQSNSQVRVEAKREGETLTLTSIEEMGQ